MANIYHQFDIPSDLNITSDIAIDTEAMGLDYNRDRLCVVQFSDGSGNAHIVHFPLPHFEKAVNLKKLLSDNSIQKIFHFARFDVGIIYKYLGVEVKNIFCTKIASRLARTYTDQHSLKELCYEILGIKISKQQQSSDWGNANLTKDQIAYAASDVLHLHKLREVLQGMLKREDRSDLAKHCFNFVFHRSKLDIMGWANQDIFSHHIPRS